MSNDEKERKQKLRQEYQIKFGSYLRQFRLNRNIGLRELEKNCEIDRHSISRIELGKKSANMHTISRIIEALEVTHAEFFKDFDSD